MSTFLHILQKSISNFDTTNYYALKRNALISLLFLFVFTAQIGATCTNCTDNKLTNGGLNSNTTGWTSVNGTFYSDNVYPQCGTAQNGLIQRTTTTGTTQFYQDVNGLTGGSTVQLTFWAGVHNTSYDAQFGMEFYNGSSTTLISQSKLQIDKILGGSPSMQFYTIDVTLPLNATRIRVIGSISGGTSNNWLKVDEVCLNVTNICANFRSLVTADANLVKTRTVTNEVNCNSGSPDRVLWLDCILDNSSGGTSGNLKYWKIISGGTFKEYCDGTATLTMRVQNVVNSNYKFDISIIFTGRTYTAPSGSPHLEGCTSAATTNWYYYTTTNGTITGVDGLSGALLSFNRKGGSFQLGTNASLYGTTGTFGASGWLMYDIITQPSAFNLADDCGADINFFLSGGNLTSTQASDCGDACALSSVLLTANAAGGKPGYTYNWSSSLGTGQTKTVNPSATTNYTVTVTDVLGCTSSDVITITVVDCCTQFNPTITGSNGICADNIVPTSLTASGGGTYIWSTGQTTATINVAPSATTTYSVTVTSVDGCVKSATKTVSVIPCEGEICFFGNNNVGATAKWVITYAVDPANDKVKIRATLSKNFVDNTYGTGAIGWPGAGHTFNQLVGSDHLQLSLLDASNVKKMEFKMDYITASSSAPSGYKSLGVTGGDGNMITGASSDVISVLTSLDVNFNQYSYILTTNSPATNSSYAPNPTYPNWIFDVWYEVEVKLSAFGAAGFGKVGITGVHASPSKTGNNTEVVTEGPCCEMEITLGNGAFVCSGGNVSMTPTITDGVAPYTYAWSTGQTSGAISVNATSTNTYTVTVTDKNGCTDTATKLVTVYQPPVLSAGEDLEVCKGTPSFIISVSASGGKAPYTYSWPNGGTGNSQMVSPTVNTTYVITVTDANGCQDTDDIFVTIIPGPTVNVGPDINLCTADEELINSVVTDIPICGSTGINDCNHTLQGTTGWIESGSSAAVCGDNAGAKLWTKSSTSNPASSITLDFGAVVTAGTVICVRMKLEHCSNTTSSLSDAKIQRSLSSGSGYTDVISSKTFSTQTYTEYCYTLSADTRYVKIIDNGKCAFRVDYVKYQTPDTYNNTIEYLWTGPGIVGSTTGPSIIVNKGGTYVLVVTDCGGCTASDAVNVNINGDVNADAGPDKIICNGTSATLTAVTVTGASYEWRTTDSPAIISMDQAITVSPTQNTTYILKVIKNGCEDTDAVEVTVNSNPTVNLGADVTVNCTTPSATLTASGGGTYIWNTNATTASITVTPTSTTTYTVTVTGANGCTATDAVVVTADKTPPTANAGADVTVNCNNASAQLKVTGNGTYLWSTGSTSMSFIVSPEVTTIYTVTVTSANGCTATDNVTVTANKAKPTASISATGNNCITNNAQLFGSASGGAGPYTYSYNGPNGFSSIVQNPLITQNGTYTLVVTDSNGCTDDESIVIFSEFIPIVITVTTDICAGESVTLTASGGGTYLWNANGNNAITNSITVSPVVTTTYVVTVTSPQGCVGTASATITVYSKPVIVSLNTTPNGSCNNTNNSGTITVNATGEPGLTKQYRINGGSWQLSNVFTGLGNGIYNVEVSYTTRLCLSQPAQTTIISGPGPVVVPENDKSVCISTPFTLSATANGGTLPYSFAWSNGANGNPINIPGIVANTTYTITVTDQLGCTGTGRVNITIKPVPVSGINGPDEVCADEFAIFTANPPIAGATYFWDFNGGITTDGDNDDVSETVSWPSIFKNTFRTVTLTITKDDCPFTYTKQVFVKQGPFLVTPGAYDVCQGGTVQIGPNPNDPNQVTPGSTFLWTPNLFLNNNSVARPVSSPPFDIVYTLTATINGCVETKQVTVNVDVNLNPIADAGPDKSICLGSPIQIGGNPTATPPPGGAIQGVVWIPAAGLNNPLLHNPTANPTVNTQYQVIVVATSGCADTATMNLTVLPKPSVTLIANPTEICNGTSTILTATPSGGTQPYNIQWSNALGAGTTKTVSPIINTSYMVTVTDFLGCTGTASVTVLVNPRPTVNVTATPTTICIGESSALQATGNGGSTPYTFEWSHGLGSGSSKMVSPLINTTYTVTITDSKGCTNTNTVTVNVEAKAKVGDFVWHDTNGNGKQEAGEPGLNDVTVTLYNALTNNQVATTTTVSRGEEDGYYEFEVCKGTYYIIFGNIPTYVRTLTNTPADDTKDSDADATTGRTADFILNPGDNNPTVDAGYYKLASIGDFVWFDSNANGIQDMGEIGVSGIQVNLTGVANDGTPVNTSQPTNGSGLYLFTNLKPGVYTVQVVKPVEYVFSPANVGGDDTKDSDSDPGTGIMSSEILTSGEDNRTYDAGLYPSIDLEIEKTFISALPNFNGSYDVTYKIDVNNLGGPGQYDLTDNQGFDTDVIINSSSYTSTAPGNAGAPLAGSGTWILANDQQIAGFGTHTYTLVVNVTLNLTDNIGNNTYNSCSAQTPIAGQGLYNKAKVYVNDILKDEDDACGDIPNVTMVKNFVGVISNANGSYNVTYMILVNNSGGASGRYNLKDTPLFDNDVTILNGNYTGQANGAMNTSGSTTLATNTNIGVGATHIYTVTFTVSLNLDAGSPDGGDNQYTPCAVSGNGPGSSPGQGLHNRAELDRTGDGITDITDDACGDLPYVTMKKDFVSVTPLANGTYSVSYQIVVVNTGGALGTYSLKDTPLFDSDVVILSGNYGGQATGPMNVSGSTTLATNTNIGAGASHTYTVMFNVRLQLEQGSNDPGNNIYTPCAINGNGPGSGPGQGLYNRAELDRTGDGITDITDDACGDLPFVTMVKDFVSVTPNNNGTYTAIYQIRVNNIGGASGPYWLKDTPLFDDDIVINSGVYSGQANGVMSTTGSTTLASGENINAGATHIYNISFNTSLNLAPGSPGNGDKIYTPCSVAGNGPGSGPGQGYYNVAELDRNGDNVTDLFDDACGDDPINMVKNFLSVTPLPDGSHYVRYEIVVKNLSGAIQLYTLKDTPFFDDDVTINAWDYTFLDVKGGVGSGPSFIGTPPVPIILGTRNISEGNTHIYTLGFNVTLNLEPGSADGGNNVYTPCSVPGNGPGSSRNQGLYNLAELDITADGVTDIKDDACGDLPYVTMRKDLVSVTHAGGGLYNVSYNIIVGNKGSTTGTYSLKDTPLFDSDVVIQNGSYSGQANGSMNTTGSTTLATNTGISAGVTHTYTVTFNVRLQIESGSNDPGDNIYTPCAVSGNGPGSGPGQGLYNRAELDRTGDGITDITDDACGDLPNVTLRKDFVGVTPAPGGTYNVSYKIIVGNTGGAAGTYSLRDTPLFDNDVTIHSGIYSGQANGVMSTVGSTTLATNTSINAGATHTYNVTFNVSLNLAPGSADGGDNQYTACEVSGNGPGSGPGQGLYNRAELDRGADGSYELVDDACGDLPNVTMYKNFVGVTKNTNGSYNVSYAIVVNNNGGASGTYSLKDNPLFDNDVTILSGNFSGVNNGSMNTVGFTTLASNLNIGQGITHIYTVTFVVRLNLAPGSADGGDNIYTACAVPGNGPGSGAGQGLYNLAELDRTGDGITDITDDACGDLPNITLVKNFVNVIPNAVPSGSYKVTYTIVVNNNGGATGSYSLLDTPLFDNDVVIHSGTYSGHTSGNMNISGSTVLADNVEIIAGGTHTYTVMFVVTLNLEPNSQDGGDNIYSKCEVPGNGPGSSPRHGLYNRAELDWTGDNIPDLTDDACGDLPGSIGDFVWEDRNANGIQDDGEPGIPNVLVRLFNQSNIQINSMLTGPNGYYLFSNLQEGSYSVGFTKLFGYQATTKDAGDDTRDSDADIVTGLTSPIFLNAGEQNLTIDAGFYRLARIGDFVWEDRNVNGLQDDFEPGLPNVTVNLTGTDAKGAIVNQSTMTNGSGMYEFTNLVPGNYSVTFVKPSVIYLPTVANVGLDDAKDSDANVATGQSPVIVLNSGENNTTIDAGFYRCAKVGDFVWLDNGKVNDVQDNDDAGLNGITVELYSASNTAVPYEVQQTRNSPNGGRAGYYLFECMPPGEYFIKVRKPDQYLFVTPNQGGDDTKDSDIVDFTNEKTLNFTVTYAQIIEDIDIGFKFKPLPVNLTRFDGRWNKVLDINELTWETASEINSDYFDVQRSFKGSEFESVGKVTAAGNSNRITSYAFNDNEIRLNGVYSYRLRQVDFDGTETYSNIVDIDVERKGKVGALIYPNPAVGLVNIDLQASEGSKVIGNIYDNVGKLVLSRIIDQVTVEAVQTYSVDVAALNPGVYTIMLNVDGLISSYKLIILK
jgi:hypothetical protein